MSEVSTLPREERKPLLNQGSEEPIPESEAADVVQKKPSLISTGKEAFEDGYESVKSYWPFFFVTLPMFCGYASLFSMQAHLMKQGFGIPDLPDGVSTDAYSSLRSMFGVGTSFLYWGNLIFRPMHNIVFSFCAPYYRMLIAFGSMMCAEIILVLVFIFSPFNDAPATSVDQVGPVWLVFLIYGLGGVGIGTFEANVLNVSAYSGQSAKYWSVLGIPFGVNTITIGGFALEAALNTIIGEGHATMIVYIFCLVVLAGGACVVYFLVPVPDGASDAKNVDKDYLFTCLKEENRSQWMMQVLPGAIAMMFNMFCVSLLCPGLSTYIYNDEYIDFWGMHLENDAYFSIFSVFTFMGDFSSRLFMAKKFVPRVYPPLFLCIHVVGVILLLASVETAPLGTFCVMFSNGSIYSQMSRFIDTGIHPDWNLISFSFWLFVGDAGSVIASLVTQPINAYLHQRRGDDTVFF
ncbi:hypothetical protein KIPB_005549 [Kipferlia bialata]|uniref:Uncharacterized protein n=1 Tax=Kipferlia bialata TaxID=797122 RepID=A0A9K3CW65_9EUKA|nr:hypothetical protein KIPB_005549 [Kipferlia bialata]|eukprot:g5549.t1